MYKYNMSKDKKNNNNINILIQKFNNNDKKLTWLQVDLAEACTPVDQCEIVEENSRLVHGIIGAAGEQIRGIGAVGFNRRL